MFSIFCDFDVLSFDILRSIFCDSIFYASIFKSWKRPRHGFESDSVAQIPSIMQKLPILISYSRAEMLDIKRKGAVLTQPLCDGSGTPPGQHLTTEFRDQHHMRVRDVALSNEMKVSCPSP